MNRKSKNRRIFLKSHYRGSIQKIKLGKDVITGILEGILSIATKKGHLPVSVGLVNVVDSSFTKNEIRETIYMHLPGRNKVPSALIVKMYDQCPGVKGSSLYRLYERDQIKFLN